MVRPSIRADPYRVRAPVVGAIDQEAANAGCTHFTEGDFRREFGHGALSKRHARPARKAVAKDSERQAKEARQLRRP
jgi:hypothetical protein